MFELTAEEQIKYENKKRVLKEFCEIFLKLIKKFI